MRSSERDQKIRLQAWRQSRGDPKNLWLGNPLIPKNTFKFEKDIVQLPQKMDTYLKSTKLFCWKMYKCKFVLILFFITFPFFSYSNESATGIIKERMEKFQESKNLMRAINKNISDSNFNVITQSAEKLNKWANDMHEFFPNGIGNTIFLGVANALN